MLDQFSRTRLLLGEENIKRLESSRVAVFGVGGVGGYAVEALARSGVGALDLIDNDKVCLTNINRQIIATHKSIGQYKVDVAEERIKDINPGCAVRTYKTFYMPDTADQFNFYEYDYVIDAGNKLDPAAFEVADIYKTSVCPLAKVMRRELKKRGIKALKVVYSKEEPIRPIEDAPEEEREISQKRDIPGSTAFVPSVAGLIIAGEVIKDLTGSGKQTK